MEGENESETHAAAQDWQEEEKLGICLIFDFHIFIADGNGNRCSHRKSYSTFASVGSETICDCVRFVISFSSISIFSLRSAQIIPSHKNVVLECVLCFACQRTSNEEEEVNEAVKNAELFICCGRSRARHPQFVRCV